MKNIKLPRVTKRQFENGYWTYNISRAVKQSNNEACYRRNRLSYTTNDSAGRNNCDNFSLNDYLSGTTTIECYQVYYLLSKPGALVIIYKSVGLVVIFKISITNYFVVKGWKLGGLQVPNILRSFLLKIPFT